MSISSKKLMLAGSLAIGCLGAGLVSAQAGPYDYGWERRAPIGHGQPAATAALPLAPGVGIASPYDRTASGAYVEVPHYRGPDGLADNLVDVSREVNGVPCGIECRDRALRRWGYAPAP